MINSVVPVIVLHSWCEAACMHTWTVVKCPFSRHP